MFRSFTFATLVMAISLTALTKEEVDKAQAIKKAAPKAAHTKTPTPTNKIAPPSAEKAEAAKPTAAQRDLAANIKLPNEKIVLPNGMNIILSPDHAVPFVAVSVWYRVGAINEEPHRTGLAHLFEHLMFEGSRHVKAGQHFKLLENAGAYDLNATTNFDRTNYYETVPKSQLELALALEASRMYWLNITQQKLDEQRAVVRREREQRIEVTPYGNLRSSCGKSCSLKAIRFMAKSLARIAI